MKPNLKDSHDGIESMLDKSWEAIPAHLEEQLFDVPIQSRSIQASRYDKLALVLNSILAVWTLGLIYTFKDLIGTEMLGMSGQLIELATSITAYMIHPGFLLMGVGFLGFTWWRFDLDNT